MRPVTLTIAPTTSEHARKRAPLERAHVDAEVLRRLVAEREQVHARRVAQEHRAADRDVDDNEEELRGDVDVREIP